MNDQEKNYFSPSELNSLINLILQENFEEIIRIKGEITNLSRSSAGHLYFSLKDSSGGLISCVFWKGVLSSLKLHKENFTEGSEIICKGKISNYNGKIQISAHSFEVLQKEGALFLEFEKTKKKLLELGFFDSSRKKPLPEFPKKICIITSPHGAVIEDIIQRVKSRFGVKLSLLPASVQGKSSIPKIIRSIEFANKNQTKFGFELLILARGGGSFEELSIFNNEDLVKTFANSKIPTISALGHESDFTLADFAADLRAPTPSAAIDMCLKIKSDVENEILNLGSRIHKQIHNSLKSKQNHLKLINLSEKFFISRIETKKSKINSIFEKIQLKIQNKIEKNFSILEKLFLSCENFNHKKILQRGYNLCWSESKESPNSRKLIKFSKDFESEKNQNKLILEFFDDFCQIS